MKKVDILRNSKFCFGPMSKNIIDTINPVENNSNGSFDIIKAGVKKFLHFKIAI